MLQRVKTFIVVGQKKRQPPSHPAGHAPCFMTKLSHFGSLTPHWQQGHNIIYISIRQILDTNVLILNHANNNDNDNDQRTSCERDTVVVGEGWGVAGAKTML